MSLCPNCTTADAERMIGRAAHFGGQPVACRSCLERRHREERQTPPPAALTVEPLS